MHAKQLLLSTMCPVTHCATGVWCSFRVYHSHICNGSKELLVTWAVVNLGIWEVGVREEGNFLSLIHI